MVGKSLSHSLGRGREVVREQYVCSWWSGADMVDNLIIFFKKGEMFSWFAANNKKELNFTFLRG